MGRWTACWAAPATYISLAASYFAPVKLVAVVGDDFAREDSDLLASRQGSIWRAWTASPAARPSSGRASIPPT